ncbi:MAG: serine/threonine-protein kinase [Polyangiales bacterium]
MTWSAGLVPPTDAPTQELNGPVQFGRYTVLARLGSGGMAEVLLAMFRGDHGFQKLVVLKRMHAQLASDAHFVRMFLDEARLAARLSHPNVVATSEVGEVDGVYFLAMEYLEGLSFDRIARYFVGGDTPIPLAFLLRVLCDILEGLHHAHELRDYDGSPLRVVHRDVTPSNIFVTVDGVAKVLDFGIAKAAMQDEATRTGTLKGKLSYMAPEQFYPDPVDRRVDLWALGVVLWEMCTGRRLFKGVNDAATYRNIISAEVPPLSRYRPDAPASLDAVIAGALARDRDHRYPDAEHLRRALESVLRDEFGAPSRADVADVMREHFGSIVEENRVAVRRFVVGEDVTDAVPLHLSTQGTYRPGSAITLAPSLSVYDLNALAADTGVSAEIKTLRDAPIATGGGDGNGDWDVPTNSDEGEENDTVQTSRDELVALGFAMQVPAPLAPAAPRVSMPSFAQETPRAEPAWTAPPEPAWTPPPAPQANFPPMSVGFDAVPHDIMAAQEADRARQRARRRAENAVGWLILVALLAGVGLLVYAQRAWIEAAIREAQGEADPARSGVFILRLVSDPSGARVFEDGAEIGRTPLELPVVRLQLASRPRQLVLRLPGRLETRAMVPNSLAPRAELRVVLPLAAPVRR